MQCRIPEFKDVTQNGMRAWFHEMSDKDLLFHPDDAPSDIFRIDTGYKTFSEIECYKIEGIIGEMFTQFGGDVYETALPFFLEKMGL